MTKVSIKQSDTAIEFTANLTKNSVVVNLTGVTSVLFLLTLMDSPYTAYSLTAAVDGTATAGNVIYTVGAGFPTVVGLYRQEWQITLSGGTILTFPSSSYNVVEIEADLN